MSEPLVISQEWRNLLKVAKTSRTMLSCYVIELIHETAHLEAEVAALNYDANVLGTRDNNLITVLEKEATQLRIENATLRAENTNIRAVDQARVVQVEALREQVERLSAPLDRDEVEAIQTGSHYGKNSLSYITVCNTLIAARKETGRG
jgi:uncharacterized protein YjcR